MKKMKTCTLLLSRESEYKQTTLLFLILVIIFFLYSFLIPTIVRGSEFYSTDLNSPNGVRSSNNDYQWSQGVYFSSLEKREQHRLLTMSTVARIHQEQPNLSADNLLTLANFADQSFKRTLDASQGQMAPSMERQIFAFVMDAAAAEASGLLPIGGGLISTALKKYTEEASTLWDQLDTPLRQVEFQRQVSSSLSSDNLLGAMSMVADAKVRSQNSPELKEFLDVYSRNHFQFGVDVSDEHLRQISALYGQNYLSEQISHLMQRQQNGASIDELNTLSKDLATNMSRELQTQAQQQLIEFKQTLHAEQEAREQAQREALRARAYQEAQYAGFHLAAFFVGHIDPKAGRTIQTIGHAYQGLNKALANFQQNQALEVGNLTATLLMSSNLLTLGMGIASMMNTGPSTDELILQALAQLSEQIEDLRQEMHERFDQVDAKLNELLQETRAYHLRAMDFARFNQAQLRRDLENLQKDIIDVQRALTPIEDRLKSLSHLIAESHNRLLQVNYERVLARCQDSLHLVPRHHNFASHEACLRDLAIEADLWASQSFSHWDEQNDNHFFALNDVNWSHAVRRIFREQGRSGQLNLDKIPNPLIWLGASQDFINLSLEGSDIWKFSGHNFNLTDSVSRLIQTGYQIKNVSTQMLSSLGWTGYFVDATIPIILHSLMNEYEQALIGSLEMVSQEIEHTKSFVPGLEADIFTNTLKGDLWQALPYTLPSKIPLCSGSGHAWDRPQGFEILFTPAIKRRLHLAQAQGEDPQQVLNFCWDIAFGPTAHHRTRSEQHGTRQERSGAQTIPRDLGAGTGGVEVIPIYKDVPIDWTCQDTMRPILLTLNILYKGKSHSSYTFKTSKTFPHHARCTSLIPYNGSNSREYILTNEIHAVHANWLGEENLSQHILKPVIDQKHNTSSAPYPANLQEFVERSGTHELHTDSLKIYAQKRQELSERLYQKVTSLQLSPEIDRLHKVAHLLRVYTELALPTSYKYSGDLRTHFYSSQNRLIDPKQLGQLLNHLIVEEKSSDLEKVWELSMQKMADFIEVFKKEAESGPQAETDVQEQIDQLVRLKNAVEQVQFGELSIDNIVGELRKFTLQ